MQVIVCFLFWSLAHGLTCMWRWKLVLYFGTKAPVHWWSVSVWNQPVACSFCTAAQLLSGSHASAKVLWTRGSPQLGHQLKTTPHLTRLSPRRDQSNGQSSSASGTSLEQHSSMKYHRIILTWMRKIPVYQYHCARDHLQVVCWGCATTLVVGVLGLHCLHGHSTKTQVLLASSCAHIQRSFAIYASACSGW